MAPCHTLYCLLPWVYFTILDSTCITLPLFKLHSTCLYITLPWLYFTLYCLLPWLYLTLPWTLLHSTAFHHNFLTLPCMTLLHCTWPFLTLPCMALLHCTWPFLSMHGSTSLYLTLHYSTMPLLHPIYNSTAFYDGSSSLYLTVLPLPWLYFTWLYITQTWFYFTVIESTLLYHGSTSPYLTLLPLPWLYFTLLDSTLQLCFTLLDSPLP